MDPSAPPHYENFQHTESVAHFSLGQISNYEVEISGEVKSYRLTLKKCKKARKVAHYTAVGLGYCSAALSSSALAASLSGIGIVLGATAAGLAVLTGLLCSISTHAGKSLEKKVRKHSKIVSLASAKHDTINNLVSAALESGNVSSQEFSQITRELAKYHDQKAKIQSRYADDRQSFDLERVREEVRQEFQKKISA